MICTDPVISGKRFDVIEFEVFENVFRNCLIGITIRDIFVSIGEEV